MEESTKTSTDLRDRMAKVLWARIKTSVLLDPDPFGGRIGSIVGITEYDLADTALAVRDEEFERLLKLTATCTCATGPDYEGPQPDYMVHGAVRAYNEAQAAIDRVRALHSPEPGQHPDFCGHDLHELPCPTLVALGDR